MRLSQVNNVLRILFLLGIPVASNGQMYSFTKVVDNSGSFYTFGSDPTINAAGVVAFHAVDRERKGGIYMWANGAITTIAAENVPGPFVNDLYPRIGNDGSILYFHGDPTSHEIRIAKNGQTKVITREIPGTFADTSLSINNQGSVAFTALAKREQYVLSSSGGSLKAVTSSTDLQGPIVMVSINDAGEIAAVSGTRLSLSSGGVNKILADYESSRGLFASVSLNNSGQLVCSLLSIVNGHVALFLQSNGKSQNLSPPISLGAITLTELSYPAINDRGQVSFVGEYRSPSGLRDGLFVWNGGTISKVIQPGDQLFGGIVDQFVVSGQLSDRYINNSGQIVFSYRLVNGQAGIAVATPNLPAPALTAGTAVNGATYVEGLVPGSWAQVKGTNLAATSRLWRESDFAAGGVLPTSLDGVEVKVNNIPAAVYYISPEQVNFQVPASISGPANVQVIRNGASTGTITASIVDSAPGLFSYTLGGKTYPSAVYAGSGVIVGDPAAGGPAVRKAQPGDRIELFATGVAPSPAGTANIAVAPLTGATASLGPAPAVVEFAGLVGVGLYQINIVVPNVPDGEYPVVIRYAGKESQPAIVIPVGR